MKHPTEIINYNGTMEELARDIANLRYDSLSELLNKLASELSVDQKKDFNSERYQVSSLLYDLSVVINDGKKITDKLWKICKNFI
jgi:hypothetical protein